VDRSAVFHSAIQLFASIGKQHGADIGIHDLADLANKQFKDVAEDLKHLDGYDKLFVSEEEQATRFRGLEDTLTMRRILGQYGTVNTQLKQHVKAAIEHLEGFINKVKQDRTLPPKTNRNAAIEKFITGLKVLKTSLDAIAKDTDAWLLKNRGKLEGYEGKLSEREQRQQSFKKDIKAAAARALAVAQKMKATPDIATYNQDMQRSARDLLEVLGVASRSFQEMGVADPAPLVQVVRPFGAGNKSHVDSGITEAGIRQLIGEFNQAAKAIQQAYSA
jgi:hypothetical protein